MPPAPVAGSSTGRSTGRGERRKGGGKVKSSAPTPSTSGSARTTLATSASPTEEDNPEGGRSKGPIWHFFKVDDRTTGTLNERKGAICQVLVSGKICGKRLLQGDSGTSGLTKHLHGLHKATAWVKFERMRMDAKTAKRKAESEVHDIYDNAEGLSLTTPAKKRKEDDVDGDDDTPLRSTPFNRRGDKHPVRHRLQLRWELWITEYLVRLGLPWSILDSEAHKDFWARENPRYHLKHSTTYSRAKLPLLYDQVKNLVDNKIRKDIPYTSGVAFTADHWTSRSGDPYLGVTMHMITKDWEMAR